MTDLATKAREAAMKCEGIKYAYRQSKDGIVVSFVLHPQEVPDGLATAALGTRYVLALVEIGDDEQPVSRPETPPAADRQHKSSETKRSWNELSASQQAGIRCNEPAFWRFLTEGVSTDSSRNGGGRGWSRPVTCADHAAEAVRFLCDVESRSALVDGRATDRWREVDDLYRAWQREPEFVP